MIVIVGLGALGAGIGRRIAECGWDVVGVDPVTDQREAWRRLTGRSSYTDLDRVPWSAVDRVFVIVRMTDQVAGVLDRLSRLVDASALIPCHLVTTLEPAFADRLGDYDNAAFRVLEQPVSGGERGALSGRLTVLSAGPLSRADEELLRATIATDVVTFDRYGEPTRAKLLNNVTGAYNVLATAHMLGVARQLGVDPERFYRVLMVSSGASWMAGNIGELHDELLTKDVALLRTQLGELPSISLDEGLIRGLREARRLLKR